MSTVNFKGSEVKISGSLPEVGAKAPDFKLVQQDLSEITLESFKDQAVVLNIFPSVDTGICALQLKTFAIESEKHSDVAFVYASLDLPFAFKRFCVAEGVENAITGSDYRNQTISEGYGLKMEEGPLAGLYARAVVVLDKNHNVAYTELVPEITIEPNYSAALEALAGL